MYHHHHYNYQQQQQQHLFTGSMFRISSSSSSDTSAEQRFPPHIRTLEVGEFRVGGGVHLVTHSSADWWDLLLPL